MAGLYPLSRMQQFDSNGRPLTGARLFLYDGGTSTPRIGYKDSSLTSAHPNPILADSAGRLPLIYLDDGFYRHRLTTRTGTAIFDDDGLPVLSTTAGGSGTSVDPDSVFKTRDVKIRFDDSQINGYVRLNGRTIGSALSSATERANADTQSLYEELWPFANISVSGGKGANAAADFAANKPLALPNCAGKGIFGMDDLGAGAQSVLTAAVVGSDPTLPGATGGAQTATIAQVNIPSYNLTGGSASSVSASGTTGTESVTHTHSGTTGTVSDFHTHSTPTPTLSNQGTIGSSGLFLVAGIGSTTTGNDSPNHTHQFTSGNESTPHTHNVTVTGTASGVSVPSGGSGTPLNKLPPLITFMIYVRL
jgi:hypothetical protein